jgi:hypothetical protein
MRPRNAPRVVPGPVDDAVNRGDTNRTTIALDELGLGYSNDGQSGRGLSCFASLLLLPSS